MKPLWRHSQGLWGGLGCTAVTLVPGAVSEGSVHLLLENMRQGMQRDAPDGGRVGEIAVQTAALKKQEFSQPSLTHPPKMRLGTHQSAATEAVLQLGTCTATRLHL